MTSTISEKGQVTIPKPVRDKLGLRPGTIINFEAEHGKLVATKQMAQDVFKKWRGRGKLPRHLSVDDYLTLVRDADRR